MGTKVNPDTIENVEIGSGVPALNENFDRLADEFDKVVYRDGSQSLSGTMDADSNRIINLPAPIFPNEAARYGDLLVTLITAEALTGPSYNSASEGLAATAEGEGFAVLNPDGTVTIYLNSGGGAVEQRSVTTSASLASNAEGAGASIIGVVGGGTVQDYVVGVSAKAFGVEPDTDVDANGYPNNPVDQASKLQAAINYAASLGITKVFVKGKGTIVLGSTITVPFGITLDFETARAMNASERGESTIVMPLATGSFNTIVNSTTTSVATDGNAQAGYLFFMNVATNNTSTWIRQFPNAESGGLKNVSIDGTPTDGISVAYFAGSHRFENIRLRKVATLARKPSVYTDAVYIHEIHSAFRANDTDYLIYLPGTGDSYIVDHVASGYTGDQSGVSKGLYVGLCRGGTFRNLINGMHEFKNTYGTMTECHLEGGGIIVDQGAMTVDSNVFYNGEGAEIPVSVLNSNGSAKDTGSVTFVNNKFVHLDNGPADNGDWSPTEKLDISISTGSMDITIGEGNRRICSFQSQLSKQQVMAPLIGDASTGLSYGRWKNLAHMLAKGGCHISNGNVDQTGIVPPLNSWNGLSNASFTASNTDNGFQKPTGTYYYSVVLFTDLGRLLGRGPAANAEVNIAATNGSTSFPAFDIDWGSNPSKGGFLARVYRGTATGVYNEYADVPCIAVQRFIDSGNAVNSFAWKSRTAGPVDSLNATGYTAGVSTYDNGSVFIRASAIAGSPTAGSWSVHDQIMSTTGTHASRICTAAGTPGTWAKLGIVGAEKAAASSATYTTPVGGATTDTQARTAISQLAADLSDLRAKLIAAGLQNS